MVPVLIACFLSVHRLAGWRFWNDAKPTFSTRDISFQHAGQSIRC
jgi:hypothetical protein